MVDQVLRILMRHLSQEQIREVVKDLYMNAETDCSFEEIVERVWNLIS